MRGQRKCSRWPESVFTIARIRTAHHLCLITSLVGDAAPYTIDYIGYGLAEYLPQISYKALNYIFNMLCHKPPIW